MKRSTGWIALAVAAALAAGCGGGDEDASGSASGTSGSASAPAEETTTTAEEAEVDDSIDRSQRRETDSATAVVTIDGEDLEVTGVTCRALLFEGNPRMILSGGNEALVFLEADLGDGTVELGEATEFGESRVSRLTVDGTTYEIAADSLFTDPTGSIDVTVTDRGSSIDVLVEGATDDGTELVVDVSCADLEGQDLDGNPLED